MYGLGYVADTDLDVKIVSGAGLKMFQRDGTREKSILE